MFVADKSFYLSIKFKSYTIAYFLAFNVNQCLKRDRFVIPDISQKWCHSGCRVARQKWHHQREAKSTGMPPDQKSKHSWGATYLSTNIGVTFIIVESSLSMVIILMNKLECWSLTYLFTLVLNFRVRQLVTFCI